MCGRFTIAQPFGIIERFKLDHSNMAIPSQPAVPSNITNLSNLSNMDFSSNLIVPRYNIAPTQDIPDVITSGGNQLVMFRWGLIPHWAREISIGSKMINARGETLREKPSFRSSLQRRRCLIPADGFYEWKREGSTKQPYRITLKNSELFGFAGLWDSWTAPSGEVINSCTIITTSPNELLEPIHNRMPVILSPAAEEMWLDPSISDSLLLENLLKPYPAELMQAYQVSSAVNSPRNDNPECITPAASLF